MFSETLVLEMECSQQTKRHVAMFPCHRLRKMKCSVRILQARAVLVNWSPLVTLINKNGRETLQEKINN
jgi:hypothetical protein